MKPRHPCRAHLGMCAILAWLLAGQAAAFEDYTGPLGGTTSFYGQLSPSVISVDDGIQNKAALVDNTHSSSRIGFLLVRPAQGREFRFRFETGLGFRQSDAVSQTYTGDAIDWERSDIRYVDFSWQFDRLGRFSIGHGGMAADQTASADLSGTGLANGVSVPDMAGGFEFRTSSGALSGVTVKSAYKTYDGIRRARLRYDTRSVSGFTLSVSAGAEVLEDNSSEKNYDIALRYENETDILKLQGAIAGSATRTDGLPTRQDQVGSFSALHKPSGLSFTISTGSGNPGGRDLYGKLGYQLGWLPVGRTYFSVDYLYNKDVAFSGARARAWGGAIVQNFQDQGFDLYLGLRRYTLSGSAVILDDLKAFQFGTRWRF